MRGRLLYLLTFVGVGLTISPALMFRNFVTAMARDQPIQYSGGGALFNLIYIAITAFIIGAIILFLVWSLRKEQKENARLEIELDEIQRRSNSNSTHPDGLTQREVEVLRLVAKGKTNQEIADELDIAFNTAAGHISNIFNKIGSQNRTEAATYAANNELLE